MRNLSKVVLGLVIVCNMLTLSGCGTKVDENKPIADVEAEAAKMDVAELKSIALEYKKAIMAKEADVNKLMADLKEIPLTQMMGDEAKRLKGEVDDLTKSVGALKKRFDIYIEKLKEKGGDVSELKL